MKSKFVRLLLAIAVTLTFSALAQTGSAATPSSAAAPASTPAGPAPATTTGPTGTKVGTINIQEAIFGSNEGQKEIQVLQKKFEPKQTELKTQNDDLESLKKQLNTQGDKLNEDAAANLKKQIEAKQKIFRSQCAGCTGRIRQPAAGHSLQNSAEDGADDREVLAGKRIRHDRGHLQALAAEQRAVVG